MCLPTQKLSQLCHAVVVMEVLLWGHDELIGHSWLNSISSPSALFQVWEWGWKFQTCNQGLVFLWIGPYPEVIFLLPLPSLTLGIILLAYKTHSYHLGNAKCPRSSVPGTREGQRSNMGFFFCILQVFFLVGEEQTRILERWPLRRLLVETTKSAMWLDDYPSRDGPLDMWKQGQGFSSKICFWLTISHEWIAPDLYASLKVKHFQVGIIGFPPMNPVSEHCRFPRV